jgi:hypothetical protein
MSKATSPANASINGGSKIVTLRIELCDTDPLIWREIVVPVSITLKTLHDIVQAAMGWTNSHLWTFTAGGAEYGPLSDGDDWRDEPLINATRRSCLTLSGCEKPRSSISTILVIPGNMS